MLAIERSSESAAHWGEGHYKALFEPGAPGRFALVSEASHEDVVVRSACERVCGFIVVRTIGPEWEIENVVVRREVRRNGIGSALLDATIQRARQANVERLLLEVRQSNKAARKLYLSRAFRESGARSAYYENPTEDAVLLQLDFC